MSRLRFLLQSLESLGFSPNKIAQGVPMPLSAVKNTLKQDWPVPPRFKMALETFGQDVLLHFHRRGDADMRVLIEMAFRRVFGQSLCDAPVLDSETQRGLYVLWMLEIDIHEVFPEWVDSRPEDNDHLVSFVHERLETLHQEAQAMDATDATVADYRRTLNHVIAVMAGEEDPADNLWYENLREYRRSCLIDHTQWRKGSN